MTARGVGLLNYRMAKGGARRDGRTGAQQKSHGGRASLRIHRGARSGYDASNGEGGVDEVSKIFSIMRLAKMKLMSLCSDHAFCLTTMRTGAWRGASLTGRKRCTHFNIQFRKSKLGCVGSDTR